MKIENVINDPIYFSVFGKDRPEQTIESKNAMPSVIKLDLSEEGLALLQASQQLESPQFVVSEMKSNHSYAESYNYYFVKDTYQGLLYSNIKDNFDDTYDAFKLVDSIMKSVNATKYYNQATVEERAMIRLEALEQSKYLAENYIDDKNEAKLFLQKITDAVNCDELKEKGYKLLGGDISGFYGAYREESKINYNNNILNPEYKKFLGDKLYAKYEKADAFDDVKDFQILETILQEKEAEYFAQIDEEIDKILNDARKKMAATSMSSPEFINRLIEKYNWNDKLLQGIK